MVALYSLQKAHSFTTVFFVVVGILFCFSSVVFGVCVCVCARCVFSSSENGFAVIQAVPDGSITCMFGSNMSARPTYQHAANPRNNFTTSFFWGKHMILNIHATCWRKHIELEDAP